MWNRPCFPSIHPPRCTINHCLRGNSSHLVSGAPRTRSQTRPVFVFSSLHHMLPPKTVRCCISFRKSQLSSPVTQYQRVFFHVFTYLSVHLEHSEVNMCFPWVVSCEFHLQFYGNNSRQILCNHCFIYILHYPWLDSYASCILCSFHVWRAVPAFLSHHCSGRFHTHHRWVVSMHTFLSVFVMNHFYLHFPLT